MMGSYLDEDEVCVRKLQDFLAISRLINLNFDIDVIVAKGISFISDRLKKRVRVYLLDDHGDLILQQWSGDYRRELHKGIVVRPGSIVWEVFEKGEGRNITDEAELDEYDHTLRSQIKIKAVIPISYKDAGSSRGEKFGAMVIDSGGVRTKIAQDDFLYSLEMGELIGQAIARARFFTEYRRMRDRLTLIQEERIKVLNVLVHELRNPLTVIGGFTKRFPGIIEQLYSTIGAEQNNIYLDRLLKYSKIIAKEEYRIEESINDFVRFLKVTDPQCKMNISRFSLRELIQEVIAKFEALAEIKNIRICSSGKDIFLDGDKEGLFTVLNNLIYNGINFSPEKSRISIYLKEDDDKVSFSVRTDTFIAKQHRKDIFDYYYKIVGKEDTGTGLGLPVAKQIVEWHGGTIGVVSRRGTAERPVTYFIVTIPRRLECALQGRRIEPGGGRSDLG